MCGHLRLLKKPPAKLIILIELTNIFEDQFIRIVNKPSGIHSAKIKSSDNLSVADILLKEHPDCDTYSEKPEDAGLLNRLDYETSGLLMIAKSRESWSKMRYLQKNENIHKSYLIVVNGKAQNEIEIDNFIGSVYKRSKKVKVYSSKSENKNALAALSHFILIADLNDKNASLLKAHATNARRHQIRAHAAFVGHSLIGDSLYGSKRDLSEIFESRNTGLPKFFLHAYELEFKHPFTNKVIKVKADLPDYASGLTEFL